MTESQNNFVPISEAISEHIHLASVLPQIVASDMVMVNLEALESITKAAGITMLLGKNESDLPTSGLRITTPGLIDGHAAGFPVVSNYRRWVVQFQDNIVLVRFNTREIGQKISEQWGSYTNTFGWASQLNNCLKGGLIEAVGYRFFKAPFRPDRLVKPLPQIARQTLIARK